MIRQLWIAAIMLGVLATGCGGPKKTVDETATACVPFDVSVEVDNELAVVEFKSDCEQLISGYNIYVSRQPLAEQYPGATLPDGIEPHNHPVFPGDTDTDDEVETYEAEGLENGVRYHVHVRTVFPGGELSAPSREVAIVPGPRGEITLAVRYESEQDGFSFARDEYVRADNVDNDLYFYTREGNDFLASPSRLGFLRSTKFRVLPFGGTLDEVTSQLAGQPVPDQERVMVENGDWVQILTEDGTFALVQVREISGSGDSRSVRMFYAYSPVEGTPAF